MLLPLRTLHSDCLGLCFREPNQCGVSGFPSTLSTEQDPLSRPRPWWRSRVEMLQAEECFPSVPSQLRRGGSGHSYVLCRVSAPFSCDICGHVSHLLRKKVVLSPKHKGDAEPRDLCDGGAVGAVVRPREDRASQPAGPGGLPVEVLFEPSPQVNRTSLGKGKQGLLGRRPEGSYRSRRRATVPVTCACLSLTERKTEEASATGPRRGLQGHRQFGWAAGQCQQKAWALAGPCREPGCARGQSGAGSYQPAQG